MIMLPFSPVEGAGASGTKVASTGIETLPKASARAIVLKVELGTMVLFYASRFNGISQFIILSFSLTRALWLACRCKSPVGPRLLDVILRRDGTV